MDELLGRLLAIGAEADDDEDTSSSDRRPRRAAAGLDDRFELSPLGPVHVKGRTEPTEAYGLRSA